MSEREIIETTQEANGDEDSLQDATETAGDSPDSFEDAEQRTASDEPDLDRPMHIVDRTQRGPGDTRDDAPTPPDRTLTHDHHAGEITTESIIEAILFATDSPLPPARIAQIIGVGGVAEVRKHIAALNEKYAEAGASFRIDEVAKGYQMLTLPEYNVWLRKLLKVRRESKLSQAALETLAVVAYKQPVMRAVIEEIRGVAVGEVLQRLREMNLVKIVGRADELGRPLLYGTTKVFLEVFGLASLNDLPKVEELIPPEKQKAGQPSEQPSEPGEAEPTDNDASSTEASETEVGSALPNETEARSVETSDVEASDEAVTDKVTANAESIDTDSSRELRDTESIEADSSQEVRDARASEFEQHEDVDAPTGEADPEREDRQSEQPPTA